MGPGRRMKKQGPPEPLDESRFTGVKKGRSAAPANHGRGKKRSASGDVLAHSSKKKSKGPPMMSGALGLPPASNGKQERETMKKAQAGKAQQAKPGKARGKPATANGRPGKIELMEDLEESEDDDLVFGEEKVDDLDILGDLDEEEIDMIKNGDFMDSDSDVVDSEDERKRPFVFSEDEDDSDGEERLTAANMESMSKRLDEERAAIAAEAEMEEAAMQTNIDTERPDVFEDDDSDGDGQRVKTSLREAPDLQMLRTRIMDTVRVLEDFSKLAQPGRSRAEYTSQFLKDICAYYGYSEFLSEKLFNLFSPREAFDFFEANESPRPIIIRTNTLKTHRRELAQALIGRGITLEPASKWSKVGLTVFESQVPLGATPEYLAGHYLIQAQSSFLPVMALAPQEHERVLDMAAAPGGKTTHMAAMMRNTGVIFANDSNKSRAKGLIGNVHRLGARNTIVCNYDARAFPTVMGGFDRVLLDAPCSGTGVIAKDPSVKTNKTEKDFMQLPHMQKQLLLAAIDSVDHSSRTGGFIVYSTCSVTVEENEQVVQYALSKRPNVKLVETGLPIGIEGFVSYMGKHFDSEMRLTRRYYPHTYNVDGFFVAKFQKTGLTPKNAIKVSAPGITGAEVANQKLRNGSTTNGADAAGPGDFTPIEGTEGGNEFGGWDDEEDREYMERAKKNSMRKKGINPKANGNTNGSG